MPDPSILEANAAENWRKLPMQFEIYLVGKGKDDKVDKLKVKMLLLCVGPEAVDEYSHFVYTGEKRKIAIKLFLLTVSQNINTSKNSDEIWAYQ